MLIFFTVLLALSIVGMVSLLGVKQWELHTDNLLLVRMRPKAGNFFQQLLFWVERVLPALVRVYARRLWRAARAWLHRVVAQGVLATEAWLEWVLHTLRHTTDMRAPRGTGTTSVFLQEVAEHKKKLLRHSRTPKIKSAPESIDEE